MELVTMLEIFRDYDLPTIIIGIFVYVHINKKLTVVDKAVNNRPADSLTLSQEVSEIHRKVEVAGAKTEYIIKEVDAHREVDEKLFAQIGEDIKGLHKRVSNLSAAR
tara:strand:- start:275 stop:595 length:321 start_codon:yes stop_codon:yes gene_type:complete